MNNFLEDIDEKKTISAVKGILFKYRLRLIAATIEYNPRITAKYTIEDESLGLEAAVIKKVDSERAYQEFLTYLNRGLMKLSIQERQIIVMSYLEEEPYLTYQIARELKLSERTFHRMKRFALCKLGLALHVAKFKNNTKKFK